MASAEDARRKKHNAVQRERRRLVRLHLYEERAHASGFRLVGGIDEVGRGPLAGPVVAAVTTTLTDTELQALPSSGRRWEEFILDTPTAAAPESSSRSAANVLVISAVVAPGSYSSSSAS